MSEGPYRTKLFKDKIMGFWESLFSSLWHGVTAIFKGIGKVWNEFWNLFLHPGFWALVALLTAAYFIMKVSTDRGGIDYCYVDSPSNKYRALYGHRSWAPNVELMSINNPDVDPKPLFDLAKDMGCPIVIKQ